MLSTLLHPFPQRKHRLGNRDKTRTNQPTTENKNKTKQKKKHKRRNTAATVVIGGRWGTTDTGDFLSVGTPQNFWAFFPLVKFPLKVKLKVPFKKVCPTYSPRPTCSQG